MIILKHKKAKPELSEAYHDCSTRPRNEIIAVRRCSGKTNMRIENNTENNSMWRAILIEGVKVQTGQSRMDEKLTTTVIVRYNSPIWRLADQVLKENKTSKTIWGVRGGRRGEDSSGRQQQRANVRVDQYCRRTTYSTFRGINQNDRSKKIKKGKLCITRRRKQWKESRDPKYQRCAAGHGNRRETKNRWKVSTTMPVSSFQKKGVVRAL